MSKLNEYEVNLFLMVKKHATSKKYRQKKSVPSKSRTPDLGKNGTTLNRRVPVPIRCLFFFSMIKAVYSRRVASIFSRNATSSRRESDDVTISYTASHERFED